MNAWIQHIGGKDHWSHDAIVRLLAQQGVQAQTCEDRHSFDYGLVFCGQITQEVLDGLRELSLDDQLKVLACCPEVSTSAVWNLMAAGATDVLACRDAGAAVLEIAARLRRWEAIEQMLNSPIVRNMLIGDSRVLKSLLAQVVEVAHFTSSAVLMQGESGTGKELFAKLIHALDARVDKRDLVILDCSTIQSELSGSEFFGHERGAFTGAVSERDGAFALADGGTLFLDEIAELPLPLQAQLLRVIQEQTYKPLGGNSWRSTSFRLVCATNLDLRKQVQRGAFRADLYYRIAGFVCHLPPLRERPEDILPLARHFLKSSRSDLDAPNFDLAVQEYLLRRDYPGNVRDLRQVVARMLSHYAGVGPITVGCIPPDDRPIASKSLDPWGGAPLESAIRLALARGAGLKTIGRESENIAIRIAVNEAGGNLKQAATRLGVTDRTLQMWRAAQRQNHRA